MQSIGPHESMAGVAAARAESLNLVFCVCDPGAVGILGTLDGGLHLSVAHRSKMGVPRARDPWPQSPLCRRRKVTASLRTDGAIVARSTNKNTDAQLSLNFRQATDDVLVYLGVRMSQSLLVSQELT